MLPLTLVLALMFQIDGAVHNNLLVRAIILLALVVVWTVGAWHVFAKAGEPGWGAIVPFYNIYLMTKIAGKPGWWVVLSFIPYVNIALYIILSVGVAESFGKSPGFGLGLVFLPFIFYPMLGFGEAVFKRPLSLRIS